MIVDVRFLATDSVKRFGWRPLHHPCWTIQNIFPGSKSSSPSFKIFALPLPKKTIKLLEDKPLVVGNFIIYLHNPEPHILLRRASCPFRLSYWVLHRSYHIRRKIWDIIIGESDARQIKSRAKWTALESHAWFISSSMWSSTKKTSPKISHISGSYISLDRNQLKMWSWVFHKQANIGYDYFKDTQKGWDLLHEFRLGGARRFHDHSNVVRWTRKRLFSCPYLSVHLSRALI